jgi:hypothetical protein
VGQARKKRVMERMAKMGGFNLFAAPTQGRPAVPVRQKSEQSVRSIGGGRTVPMMNIDF